MRVIGLTLGDCDLNDIPQADLAYVKSQCGGEPWSPSGSDATAVKCSIRVIADPTKSRRNANYGAALYHVNKVLTTGPK